MTTPSHPSRKLLSVPAAKKSEIPETTLSSGIKAPDNVSDDIKQMLAAIHTPQDLVRFQADRIQRTVRISDDPTFIAFPTHDGRMVIHSLVELIKLSNLLPGGIELFTAEGGNIPRTRNMVMDQIRSKRTSLPDPCWVLWVDSDILFADGTAEKIAKYCLQSQETGVGWTAHYKMADGTTTVMKNRGVFNAEHYTPDELYSIPDGTRVGMAGFGLTYLPMPIEYVFHADSAGEDIHFWVDNPQVQVGLAKEIVVRHRKAVWL